ncbi:MAG: hypothetical protein JNK02_05125 [Planctomycetes bacterium]|nr:hypothetical protein [Planctomycetota bacterium]
MDFLLECVGFPPDHPLDELVGRALRDGEPAAWRGDPRTHRRLALVAGVDLAVERGDPEGPWTVVPQYRQDVRLRVAVEAIRPVPDSRFDALLLGWAAPPVRSDEEFAGALAAERAGVLTLQSPGAYPIAAYLSDARRLPTRLVAGHVLAVTLAGFALDVAYLGPNEGVFDRAILEREGGACIEPLGGREDPGGCAEVSLRIQAVRHLRNPITGRDFDLLTVDAPERPHTLFVSRWQLERDRLPAPRPGLRIEGVFLFSGRIAGGLGGPRASATVFG